MLIASCSLLFLLRIVYTLNSAPTIHGELQTALENGDFIILNKFVTIVAGTTEAILEIPTLLDFDDSGNVIDINEVIESFEISLHLGANSFGNTTVKIDDDFVIVELGSGPSLLKRNTVATSTAGNSSLLGFGGGSDEEGSGGDQILSHNFPEAKNLPLNGQLDYFDDWTFIFGTVLSFETFNPFANGWYDAGTRNGDLMTHDGATYYYAALLDAAKEDKIDDKDDFDDFLKDQKRYYRVDQAMRKLRTHLFKTNNAVHRELLKLQDKFWFKTGISAAISYNEATKNNWDKVKSYVSGVKDVTGAIQKIMKNIPKDVLENITFTLREAKLVETVVATGVVKKISTFALEFTKLEKVLVMWDSGNGLKGVLYEKQAFESITEIKG